MIALRRQLDAVTRLALLAMLALVLMPSVSHALAATRGGPADWAAVCAAAGAANGVPDAASGDRGGPVPMVFHIDHCPLCAVGGSLGMPALVAPQLHAVPADGLGSAAPRPLPRPRIAWVGAQPRAPPQGL